MLTLFLTVALVQFFALMTPGPDFFFISQLAARRSRREAMLGVLGITLGVMAWAAVALMGLNLILQRMSWLHHVITLAGGCYLLWMGWQLLRSAWLQHKISDTPATPPEVKIQQGFFLKGLLTNLSNPKALIYFGTLFSLIVGDDVNVTARWGLFVLITTETFLWFALVAMIFGMERMRQGYQSMARWIDGMAGALFAGFGIHLIIAR